MEHRSGRSSHAVQAVKNVVQLLDREHLNEPYEFGVAYELLGEILASNKQSAEAIGAYRIAIEPFRRCEATNRVNRITKAIDQLHKLLGRD